MEWVTLIIGILKLGYLILTEVFEAKKRAREKQEKYELTMEKFNELAKKAMQRMKDSAKKEDTNSADDAVDKELGAS